MPLLRSAATPLAESTRTRPTTAMITAVFGPAPASFLAPLGHQDEAGPDDGEHAQAGAGVGHRGQGLCRRRPAWPAPPPGPRRWSPAQPRPVALPSASASPGPLPAQDAEPVAQDRPRAVCSAGGSTGSGSGRTRASKGSSDPTPEARARVSSLPPDDGGPLNRLGLDVLGVDDGEGHVPVDRLAGYRQGCRQDALRRRPIFMGHRDSLADGLARPRPPQAHRLGAVLRSAPGGG